MKTTKLLFAGLAMLAGIAVSEAKPSKQPKLKIYKGERRSDTVRTSTFYVIGLTEPGNQAFVNRKGEKIAKNSSGSHVYSTGCFGEEFKLEPGENIFEVTVKNGKSRNSEEVKVYYDTISRPAGKAVIPAVKAITPSITGVTLPDAYLQYSTGGDRLGGSKMNFLEAGIPLEINGQIGDLYRVALGSAMVAYIPKESVKIMDDEPVPVPVNSLSGTLDNTGKTDRVVISFPRRLPYWSRTEIDPQTIKITFYGAYNNTNWLSQHGKLGIIEFVDLVQEAGDAMSVVIRLNDKYNWGYSAGYREGGNSFVIDVRHRPQSLHLEDLTIGLDAGHGGKYNGAVSVSGLLEKDINLDIVKRVAELLKAKGARVVLTREGDTGPSMGERKRIWREAKVDIAISVHNNASGNPLKPMGTSCYYKHISNRKLAMTMQESMLELGVADFGVTGNFNFSLNGPTDYPNTLVEVLFMSCLPEEELLSRPSYRQKIAERIVRGLENYLAKAEKD